MIRRLKQLMLIEMTHELIRAALAIARLHLNMVLAHGDENG
jgi:hypothetical protein